MFYLMQLLVYKVIKGKSCMSIFPRRDIPIGVSLYSPTGTAYIEPLVESQKSTRTAKKRNTVLS